ncbi:thymidine phosphorylase, partial [Gardnerella vaginalis]
MSTSLNSQSSSIHSSRSAFMPSPIGASRPSRPAQMDPAMLAQIEGGTDPQIVNE